MVKIKPKSGIPWHSMHPLSPHSGSMSTVRSTWMLAVHCCLAWLVNQPYLWPLNSGKLYGVFRVSAPTPKTYL